MLLTSFHWFYLLLMSVVHRRFFINNLFLCILIFVGKGYLMFIEDSILLLLAVNIARYERKLNRIWYYLRFLISLSISWEFRSKYLLWNKRTFVLCCAIHLFLLNNSEVNINEGIYIYRRLMLSLYFRFSMVWSVFLWLEIYNLVESYNWRWVLVNLEW